jgi:hypothetical protein
MRTCYPWTYREDRDERCKEARLAEAIERHLALAGAPAVVRLARSEQAAFEQSQAELFRLVEDIAGVDPLRLGCALTA